MNQDVNKIVDNLNAEWSADLANAKRKIAILGEEVRLRDEKIKKLGKERESEDEDAEE